MKRWFITISKLIVVTLIVSLAGSYFVLRSSLPTLQGDISAQVDQPVTVTRDNLGVPTLIAQSRGDLSFALGYLHGQERFFQMDLLRRNSAGELAELFGPVAVNHDKKIRAHQFRKRASRYLSNLSKAQLGILFSYTAGVNQGLDDLSLKPFEYFLLNKPTVRWRPEDTFLVLYSMYMDLQHEFGERERVLGQLKNNLMPDVYDFLTPAGSIWDAAIDNSQYQESKLPTSGFDLAPVLNNLSLNEADFNLFGTPPEASKGSNSWAIGGQISKTGSAILADDMHLGLGVPNIWYRASFRYQDQQHKVRVDGVTLPGTPVMVVGSNHKVAWGFTNSYGDWNDVILLRLNEQGDQYLTPDGYKPFELETEVVLVSGAGAESIEIKKTIWGPVIGRNEDGTYLALRWVAHDAQGVNLNIIALEQSQNVEQAIHVANRSGIPAQNFVTADNKGNIGWTIAGPMPKKFGASNSSADGWAIPQDWSQGKLGWRGYLSPNEYPKVINPNQHRLWTGNSRVVGGKHYEKIGNGGYALGARSQQIRDGLFANANFDEAAMFALQQDDKAVFLTRWHGYLLDNVLSYDFVQAEHLSSLLLHLQNWQQRASVDSVGYLFVRQFRANFQQAMFRPLEESIQAHAMLSDQAFSLYPLRHQLEIPMWQMLTARPDHLLPKDQVSWQTFLQNLVKQTVTELESQYGSLDEATWGARNTLAIQHPLSKAVPGLSWLLDMPAMRVSGDKYMPKVQGPAFGASQRLVVSPGFEHQAILTMPAGQSSHPLSPFFGLGHKAWAEGSPTPLLPGKTEYQLSFTPP